MVSGCRGHLRSLLALRPSVGDIVLLLLTSLVLHWGAAHYLAWGTTGEGREDSGCDLWVWSASAPLSSHPRDSLITPSILIKPPTWHSLIWGCPEPHQNIPKNLPIPHLRYCKQWRVSPQPHPQAERKAPVVTQHLFLQFPASLFLFLHMLFTLHGSGPSFLLPPKQH